MANEKEREAVNADMERRNDYRTGCAEGAPSHLVRCHRLISEDYPEIATISAEGSADFLLHLKDTGRIDIKLHSKDGNRIECEIIDLRKQDKEPLT